MFINHTTQQYTFILNSFQSDETRRNQNMNFKIN